jgi:hypothetical protein
MDLESTLQEYQIQLQQVINFKIFYKPFKKPYYFVILGRTCSQE